MSKLTENPFGSNRVIVYISGQTRRSM